MSKKDKVSEQIADQALAVTKATTRPGQTKEQTKYIAQGVEKGIAEFKKREKAKARERDKKRKKEMSSEPEPRSPQLQEPVAKKKLPRRLLPWLLLIASWVIFILYQITRLG